MYPHGASFRELIGHLDIFYCRGSLQVLCTLFNQAVLLLSLRVLYIFWIKVLLQRYKYWNIFSWSVTCLYFCNSDFGWDKFFTFCEVQVLIFYFMVCAFELELELFLTPGRCSLIFSSIHFIVFPSMFRSPIHFESIFAWGKS